MDIYSLDVETRPIKDGGDYAALEPWRVRQDKAEISSISVCYPDDSVKRIVNKGQNWVAMVRDLLSPLQGKRVFAHNAGFDIGWNITTLQPNKFSSIPKEINQVQWADTMTLIKWLINGQKPEEVRFSYSLANLVETFLLDHPMTQDYLKMKKENITPGTDDEYWQARGDMDVIMTRALAIKLLPKVPKSMQVGLMTEWADLVPVANAWVNGIKINEDNVELVESTITDLMDECTSFLGVEAKVLSSPKQLGNLLFNTWGLTPRSHTPTGMPCTSGDDLLWLQYDLNQNNSALAERLKYVIKFKDNKTLKSKYVDTLKKSLSYTGDGYIYGIPKLFGTYTGRMTYANATVKNGPKVSIALHQIPRIKPKNEREVKMIRSLMIAPEGFGVIEADASGQESRLMAIRSGDPVMLNIFTRNLNFHGMTGAAIIGMYYNKFMEEFHKHKEGYYIEQRQLGKLTNLSCNYRIGGNALSEKAFTEYDTFMTPETGRFLVNTFSRQYAGVPQYWRDVVREAQEKGYTEAFGGRRYKLHKWDEKYRWMTESSAINFPIQGSGGSMKEIALCVLHKKLPESIFCLDLHDATFNFAPLDDLKEIEKEQIKILNAIDYEAFWGFIPPIPLTYESGSGTNFGAVK